MSFFDTILTNLPEVAGPTQKRLSFKEKLKWTLITLLFFFALGLIPLFGLGQNALEQFEFLSIILGAKFGSLISLGIGPLVTSSIVLQLLNGSGIVKFDLTSTEGKKRFQGIQKLLSFFFILFEGTIYVLMGGLSPIPELRGTSLFVQLQILLILQLFVGGVLIMFMDEIISKWGFGSGISLFIAAGVGEELFVRSFSWLASPANPGMPAGAIPALFVSLSQGNVQNALLMIASLVATILVFMMAVYAQAMKVEIPLSFGRIRGHGIRWPLSFMYTSNIPVILVAALLANIQLWARLLQNAVAGKTAGFLYWLSVHFLGQFTSAGSPTGGLVAVIQGQDIVGAIIKGSLNSLIITNALIYLLIMMVGSVIFSIFWVQTSGMDAESQAKQMMSSGLQIPGFRRDQRVLERLLERYIWPLTVMGGLAVGFLAGVADLSGALSRGTGILLAVMIVYKLYEEIAQQHMMDMNPMLRKFMEH
ncbi:preprotein translocase subunit SecY [Candidatus Woesearchaeota archaeon]|nr:MAG: preprotein translocase subunit SecY, preprotein translocase subunit SecY [archaeon GW2011_AR4]MBS3129169.1 preprotein translocase subunit SecY [Candidatus Woesearchaeota archaeon]HIH37902.1 preprotein translocase subunit SecY [Candidatus Woesearchaeota archaeon]HIH48889.1 preprotein translocase subunit SecY [Candidatus Woesearchaeota archaeon]HIJ04029.1 preprotein translocase subunit SecY [Candidatus Woesearchaeota archaeon]